MNRQLIQAIFDKIASDLPEVKKTGLFNNSFDKIREGQLSGIQLPSIYVSFPNGCTYVNQTSGVQRSDEFIVRLNIGFRILSNDKILDAFDFKDEVFKAFHKWQPLMTSSFERVAETAD